MKHELKLLIDTLSQTELAQCIGCDQSQVSRWLAGEHHPKPETAAKIRRLARAVKAA